MFRRIPEVWSEAGLTDVESGTLEKALVQGNWQAPHVLRLTQDRLLWRFVDVSNEDYRPTEVSSGPGLLEDFVKLGDAPARAIRGYAARWGALHVCGHRPPYPPGTEYPGCWESWKDGYFSEPLEAWRQLSRVAYAVLQIAAALHQGRPGDSKDWETFYEWSDWHVMWSDWHQLPVVMPWNLIQWTNSADNNCGILSILLNEWLYLGGVGPQVSWRHEGPRITLSGRRLFGALALQLALVAIKGEGWSMCYACGRLYTIRGRRPQKGRRTFCPECGKKASDRQAQRDARQRKRERGSAP